MSYSVENNIEGMRNCGSVSQKEQIARMRVL
jgi:hypothetical protein